MYLIIQNIFEIISIVISYAVCAMNKKLNFKTKITRKYLIIQNIFEIIFIAISYAVRAINKILNFKTNSQESN